MLKLHVNDRDFEVDAQEDELLVWVINEKLGLSKTKFGCGIEMCGSCKVMLDGEIVRSCVIKAGKVIGKKIVTSEQDPTIREK